MIKRYIKVELYSVDIPNVAKLVKAYGVYIELTTRWLKLKITKLY